MYNQNPKQEIFSHLFYEDPKGGWEYCSVAWVDGELAYYSPLLPNADPIPPIPFRLGNGSNRYWENYMLDTGVRHPDKIKDLIKKYDFATVKYDKYQVIPSTEYNIQRLERLLTAQFLLWSTAVEKEFNDSLKTRTTKTKEQQNQETKKDIARTINSTDITPNTVKLADKARLLYDCTIGYSYVPWKPDVAYLYRLSKVNLVRKILSGVDLRAGYTEDSLATWFARWQSREAKNKVASYLKIQIGTSPVKFLNAVLKKLGLKVSAKQVRIGTDRERTYSVRFPDDFPLQEAAKLFSRWHESDRLRYGGSHLSDNAILESIESFIFVRDTV